MTSLLQRGRAISLNGLLALAVFVALPELSASPPHIVALDIGHDSQNGGARSARGIMEFEFNKKMVEEVYSRLQDSPVARGVIINPAGQPIPLYQRTEAAAKVGAELFLSVHHDSVQTKYLNEWVVNNRKERFCDQFKGFSVFYSPKNPSSQKSALFARLLGAQMKIKGFEPSLHHAEKIPGEGRKIIDPDTGLYEYDDLIVLKTAKVPAALIECGIIVNRSEEKTLSESETRSRIATAIASAIVTYFTDDRD